MKQIAKNLLQVLAVACFFTGFPACNEDKGNYDYTEINAVDSIKGIEDSYTYTVGDTLRITPKLVFTGEDESNFIFLWYTVSNNQRSTLQQGRNLEIPVDTPHFRRNSTYRLMYEVINLTSQVQYSHFFTVQVVNELQRGFLALCQKEGQLEIDLIARSSTNRLNLYTDLLQRSGSAVEREGVTPWDIVTCEDQFAPDVFERSGNYSIYLLTDRYTTRLKPVDYTWKPSYDISNLVELNSHLDTAYVQKGKPIIAQKIKFTYHNTAGRNFPRVQMYLEEPDGPGEGNWYIYNTYPMYFGLATQMNRIRTTNPATTGKERFEPAPHTSLGNNYALYYNKDNSKFMVQSLPIGGGDYGTTPLFYSQPIDDSGESNGFNFSESNNGVLYMGEGTDFGYALLKLANGSFKYIEFGPSASQPGTPGNMIASKKRASLIDAGSNIGDAKFFARHPEAGRQFLYYVTSDNRIYKADISTATASFAEITSSILTGGYSEITAFKYTTPESSGLSDVGSALAVATYDATQGLDTGGKLEFFLTTDNSGDLTLAKYPKEADASGYQIDMSWTGLGKVVGVAYKKN